jgi:hypothetical protein
MPFGVHQRQPKKKNQGGRQGSSTKAEAARAAKAEAAEAEAAEARRASARHARQAQLAGSVAEVNASRADKVAFAEAELMLTVGQVALRKMRAQGHGWVCALWVQKQLRVFLARDLDGGDGGRKEGWIEEVVAGGRKERAPVRVAEGRLESQRLVVMDGQEFFFFDIDGVASTLRRRPRRHRLRLAVTPRSGPRPRPLPLPSLPRSSRRLVPALRQTRPLPRRPRRSRPRARRVGLLRGRATTRVCRPTRTR